MSRNRAYPALLLVIGSLLAVLTTTAASATPRSETVSYRYSFCHDLERYGQAIDTWSLAEWVGPESATRTAARKVIDARKAAWRAIQRERSQPGVSAFSRQWRKQHFGRTSVSTSRDWQRAAESADRFVDQYCFPLTPLVAPPEDRLTRLL